jgi:KUP system potassium uptake protein
VILAALFWMQHKGTQAIGRLFGPVMLAWFAFIAGFGAWHLWQQPVVLKALNPFYGLHLIFAHPLEATKVLGFVVLAVTGAEALYADMGHFGRQAIARAWYFAAFPGLVLSYFGQGAYVLSHPGVRANPFFALAGDGPLRFLLLGLSTLAAIIASQALISGTFSLTRQAIQLGYFPRLRILHTNPDQPGQIYLPLVNTTLAIMTIAIVLQFESVDRLTTAYGVAVTGSMAVTTLAFYRVTRTRWSWPLLEGPPPLRDVFCRGSWVFHREPAQVRRGRLAAFRHRGGDSGSHADVETGRAEIYRRVYGNNVTESELTAIARSKHVTRVPGAAVFMVGIAQRHAHRAAASREIQPQPAPDRGAPERDDGGSAQHTEQDRLRFDGNRRRHLARGRPLRLYAIARRRRPDGSCAGAGRAD